MTASVRGAKKEATRAKLIEVAHRLFAAKGFSETNIREIAFEAGVSERTFYRYFETKDELLFPNLRGVISGLLENLRSVPDDVPVGTAIEIAVRGADLALLPKTDGLRAIAIGLSEGKVVMDIVRLIVEFEFEFAAELRRRIFQSRPDLSDFDINTYALVIARFIFSAFRSTMNAREGMSQIDTATLPSVQEHMVRVLRLLDPTLPPLT